MLAMSMFILFTGLMAYGLFSLIRRMFGAFDAKIKKMANAVEVAVDAFKYTQTES